MNTLPVLWKLVLALFLPFATMSAAFTEQPSTAAFAGSYKLVSITDADLAPIAIPDGSDFKLTLKPAADFTTSGTYDLQLALGNRLGGRLTLTDEDEATPDSGSKQAVRIGPIRSTMMMPPPEIFKLEMALSDILPDAQTIELQPGQGGSGALLVLQGAKGKLVCEQV